MRLRPAARHPTRSVPPLVLILGSMMKTDWFTFETQRPRLAGPYETRIGTQGEIAMRRWSGRSWTPRVPAVAGEGEQLMWRGLREPEPFPDRSAALTHGGQTILSLRANEGTPVPQKFHSKLASSKVDTNWPLRKVSRPSPAKIDPQRAPKKQGDQGFQGTSLNLQADWPFSTGRPE